MKAESSDVLKTVDEDRKYVIQATIVRIMKARKVRLFEYGSVVLTWRFIDHEESIFDSRGHFADFPTFHAQDS